MHTGFIFSRFRTRPRSGILGLRLYPEIAKLSKMLKARGHDGQRPSHSLMTSLSAPLGLGGEWSGLGA